MKLHVSFVFNFMTRLKKWLCYLKMFFTHMTIPWYLDELPFKWNQTNTKTSIGERNWHYIENTCKCFSAEASPSAVMLSNLIACLISISISVVIWTSGTLTPLEIDFSMAETYIRKKMYIVCYVRTKFRVLTTYIKQYVSDTDSNLGVKGIVLLKLMVVWVYVEGYII